MRLSLALCVYVCLFDPHSYDAALIACSIQYLQKPEAVLQEIHRVLKPQGKVRSAIIHLA